MSSVIGTVGLISAGAILSYALAKRAREEEETGEELAAASVRDAGPEAMENPPRRWEMVDQQADESFPASDPPGNY